MFWDVGLNTGDVGLSSECVLDRKFSNRQWTIVVSKNYRIVEVGEAVSPPSSLALHSYFLKLESPLNLYVKPLAGFSFLTNFSMGY